MSQHGLTHRMISESLRERGIRVSRAAVGQIVTMSRYVNHDVMAEFCRLTGTTHADAWPDFDEPTDERRTA